MISNGDETKKNIRGPSGATILVVYQKSDLNWVPSALDFCCSGSEAQWKTQTMAPEGLMAEKRYQGLPISRASPPLRIISANKQIV